MLTNPYVGVKPATLQKAAGQLIDPPVLSHKAICGKGTAATTPAAPPLLPPQLRSGSCGFFGMPYALCTANVPCPNSSMLVLPAMNPPASFRRATAVASKGGTYPESIFEPALDWRPAVQMLSLTVIGNPYSSLDVLIVFSFMHCISRSFLLASFSASR